MIPTLLFIGLVSLLSFVVMGNFFSRKSKTYQVSFDIYERGIGAGCKTFSYNPSKTSFGTIKKIHVKHFEKACPPDDAVKMEYREMKTIDLLDSDISKYWVQYSIEETGSPDQSYHVTYFSNVSRSYKEGVRTSIAAALKELKELEEQIS